MAGEKIVDDYQFELRGLLMGRTTVYGYVAPGIDGLGNEAKTQDTDLAHGDGVVLGREHAALRVITLPLRIRAVDDADAWESLADLREAWAPVEGAPIEFHWRLPGSGHQYVVGKPLRLRAVTADALFGLIDCFGEFRAGDPTIHQVEGGS